MSSLYNFIPFWISTLPSRARRTVIFISLAHSLTYKVFPNIFLLCVGEKTRNKMTVKDTSPISDDWKVFMINEEHECVLMTTFVCHWNFLSQPTPPIPFVFMIQKDWFENCRVTVLFNRTRRQRRAPSLFYKTVELTTFIYSSFLSLSVFSTCTNISLSGAPRNVPAETSPEISLISDVPVIYLFRSFSSLRPSFPVTRDERIARTLR